jgi:hypothetical protein
MAIPPPPDENSLYGGGNTPPPPPPEEQLYGGRQTTGSIPPPPDENALFNSSPPERTGVDRLAHDIHGAYLNGALNGFGGLVARKAFEWIPSLGDAFNAGPTRLRQEYPGHTDQWYQDMYKQVVNNALITARQKAGEEEQQNAINVHIPNPFDNGQNLTNLVTGKKKSGFDIDPVAATYGFLGGADPTLAIPIPGIGAVAGRIASKGVANYAAKVAVSTAAHAAYGAASDAAYQGADIVDGIQKKFDVDRTLHAAEATGVLGGLGQAASPFVRSLFEQRNGLDTTPPPTPEGTTNPFSGAQGMTRDQLLQYHNVLRDGNESDIHNFFNDKNIIPPTHTDIHEWVKRRDQSGQQDLFDQTGAEGKSTDQLVDDIVPGPPDLREAVQNHIDKQTASWKNKPDFEIINHTDEIADPAIQESAVKEGADNPDALGFLGGDGKVRIFANKIDSPETLNAILYHESLGHYGLQQLFGARLDSMIGNLLNRNVGQFGADVNTWIKKNPGAYNGDRIRAGEEVLANMSNNGTLKPSLADALTSHVRGFGRKMGLKLSYSDAEVRQILNMAHQAVINGKGRDVRANGFATQNSNKFMFAGPKAQGFDENHPMAYTAKDGITRNEISDQSSSLKQHPYDFMESLKDGAPKTLGEILDHPRLYEAYPQLKELQIRGRSLPEHYQGYYLPAKDGAFGRTTPKIVLNTATNVEVYKTLLHETQHAIQDIEGIPGVKDGTNNNGYDNNPLEHEAFATEDRAKMGAVDRINNRPVFMRRGDLEPKDIADEAYQRLDREYKPTGRTWEQAQALAKDTALSPEAIRESRAVGNLDRKLFVYDNAAKEANAKLMSLKTDGPLSAEDHVAALETAAHFNYVLGRIENDARQIARGLNALKAVNFSRNNLLRLKNALASSDTNMDALTDPDTMLKFLKQYQEMAGKGNPNGAANLLKGVTQPYWWQYLLSFRQNMMLSALSTHLKSTMDMGTMIGRELQESTLALPGSAVRETLRSLGATNIKPGAHPTELAAKLWGLTRAALEAKTYADTWRALKNGTPQGQNQWANSGSTIEPPRIPGVSKVSDLISAQDTFFRSFLMNQNLHALGARMAYEKLKALDNKVSWDDVMTNGAAIARSPSPEMIDHARELTENTILLNKSPLNTTIDKARKIVPGMNVGEQATSFFTNLFTPFIRVGSNAVMNQFIRKSPLAFLDPVTRADFQAGGARSDIAVARIAMGTALLGYYWNQSNPKKDKIEGEGPDNRDKLLEKEAGGYSPNSIHENGRYNQTSNLNISLNPLDVHNNIATMVAGLREAYESGADSGKIAVGLKLASVTMLHQLSNQTWLEDISSLVDSLTDRHDTGGQKLGKVGANIAKSFLPNVTNQLAHQIDLNRHDTTSDTVSGTIGNTVESNIPGATNNLPIRYNVYGQPVKTGTSITGIHTWVDPGNGQNEVTDPAEKELSRLAGLTKAAIVTPTSHTVTIEGQHLKLTPSQIEDYQKYAGQTIVQAVRSQMENGQWNSMKEQDRINYIRSVQTQAKKQVRDTLLQQPGWLNEDQLNTLRSQISGSNTAP